MHWWRPCFDARWSGCLFFWLQVWMCACWSRRSSMHWWWPCFDARWRTDSLVSGVRAWMCACWSRRDWTFKIDPSHTASMRASSSCDGDKTCCGCVVVDERSSSISSSSSPTLHMIDVRWWLRFNQSIQLWAWLMLFVGWLIHNTNSIPRLNNQDKGIALSLSLSLSLSRLSCGCCESE